MYLFIDKIVKFSFHSHPCILSCHMYQFISFSSPNFHVFCYTLSQHLSLQRYKHFSVLCFVLIHLAVSGYSKMNSGFSFPKNYFSIARMSAVESKNKRCVSVSFCRIRIRTEAHGSGSKYGCGSDPLYHQT